MHIAASVADKRSFPGHSFPVPVKRRNMTPMCQANSGELNTLQVATHLLLQNGESGKLWTAKIWCLSPPLDVDSTMLRQDCTFSLFDGPQNDSTSSRQVTWSGMRSPALTGEKCSYTSLSTRQIVIPRRWGPA